jgi:hypothetical protein
MQHLFSMPSCGHGEVRRLRLESGTEVLEDEALRRATTGGSDVLLIFLLKAKRPTVYREPRAAVLAASLTPEDLRAVEEARRVRELSTADLDAELRDLEARRAAADQARNWHRGNGAADP